MPNTTFNAPGVGAQQNTMMQQFPRFMQVMRGKDPNQALNELVSSGQVSQTQLNAVQQRYQQIGGMFSQFKSMFGF